MDAAVKEMIEKRAYHLFLKRGGVHGYSLQDWVQAEKEITAEISAGKSAAPAGKPSAPKTPPAKQPVESKPAAKPTVKPTVKPKAAGVKGSTHKTTSKKSK